MDDGLDPRRVLTNLSQLEYGSCLCQATLEGSAIQVAMGVECQRTVGNATITATGERMRHNLIIGVGRQAEGHAVTVLAAPACSAVNIPDVIQSQSAIGFHSVPAMVKCLENAFGPQAVGFGAQLKDAAVIVD